jgi:protein involved in sex pheromone biosynthesis
MRWFVLAVLGLLLFLACCGPTSKAQDEKSKLKQEVEKEKLKDKVKDAIKPKEEEKEKSSEIGLYIKVPKDCKIIVNEKPITYEKFEVLMEYTINAFVIEEMAYRQGQFTALKMRSRGD